ncbi:hypothetical protein GHT72_028275 (plasmid) [Klebsiella pneumoniae]|nr:hypothetical protein [Klebsiella phage KpF2]
MKNSWVKDGFQLANAHIIEKVRCRDCHFPLICVMNITKPPYDEWDWWIYCSNKTCKNHEGEGKFQNTPDFVERING